MNDFSKLFETMLEQGKRMADEFDPTKGAFSFDKLVDMMPAMPPEMMEAAFGKSFNKDGLDAKTRLMTLLAAMVASGATLKEPQIRMTIRNLRETETTRQEIIEVIMQSAVYGGAPSMTKAMQIAQSVFEKEENT